MPDTKITSLLTPQVTTNPATDVLPIVNIADTSMASSGSTRKITVNTLLGAGGTATLASATITGDLTVDTSTLKVDSANNRVGIGTATPNWPLSIVGSSPEFVMLDSGGNGSRFYTKATNTAIFIGASYSTSSVPINFTLDGGSSNAMTLNSNGLGVGASPANGKLIVGADATTDGNGSWNTTLRNTVGAATTAPKTGLSFSGYWNGTSNFANFAGISGGKENTTDANTAGMLTMWTSPNGGSPTTRLTIDSSGNVGIGVTPITSHILSCSGPVGITGTLAGTRTSYITNASAASIYYTDGGGSGYFTDFGNLIIQPRTSAARSVVIATGSTTPVERAVVKSTGQVRFVPLAADPAGAEAGDVYYNSVSNRLKYYNGTAWTLI